MSTRLVDELTTLLYEVLKRWEVEGRVCEIVQCGACRKKADRPSSVVHESDCPVHRLWQALEIGEVVVKANAEEICDLEDARDALEAKVNALTAEMECRNQLTSRIASLEAENARLRAALERYSSHRLALIASETANQMRATVAIDLMDRRQAIAALDSMREYVCRTVPPMLESLRQARAALAASAGEG